MKKTKQTKLGFTDIPQDCLNIIYTFLDFKTFGRVFLSSKYFYNQIETPVFWREACKSTDSFKKSYLDVLKLKSNKVTGKLLRKLSKVGKQNRIINSQVIEFVKKICKNIASAGFDGIYYNYSKDVEEITPMLNRWPSVQLNTKYFDFYKIDNIKDYGVDELEIFNIFKKEFYNNVFYKELLKYFYKQGIYFKNYEFKYNRIKFSISWEKKNDAEKRVFLKYI